MSDKVIKFKNFPLGNDFPFVLIAGPCQLEGLNHSRQLAEQLSEICFELEIPFIFKGSFDKANRTSKDSPRGIGFDKGLSVLDKIAAEFNCPVLTDVHETTQCNAVAQVVDILQIPAFLCRQTDLLIAAGKTKRVINVKKGQFLAPHDMRHVAEKISSTDNDNIMLCERGSTFGYNSLVSDFRSIPIMRKTGYPVVFDATHSVQYPGGNYSTSGGDRYFVPVLSKAACAVGIAALFLEVHEDPDNAPSDGANMMILSELKKLLAKLKKIDSLIKEETLQIISSRR